MPAHFCGVYGLKPSFGRIPYHPVNAGDFTSHIGPLTRNVADAALMTQIIAGPHPLDHTTLEAWPADYPARLHEGIAGKRIEKRHVDGPQGVRGRNSDNRLIRQHLGWAPSHSRSPARSRPAV